MQSPVEELKDQGRGVIGALLLGTPILFTSETWWLAQRLPVFTIVLFAAGGLLGILVVSRVAGFRREGGEAPQGPLDWLEQYADLVLQSVVASFILLFLFGIADLGDSLDTVVRLGLVQIVPLGLGAALANSFLKEAKGGQAERSGFPRDVATFSLGALIFGLTIAPTQDVDLILAKSGWWRLSGMILFSLLVAYVTLYELGFRGQAKRISGRSVAFHMGQSLLVYGAALLISTLLLIGYGRFSQGDFEVWVAYVIVVAFPATLGGSIAQVGVG